MSNRANLNKLQIGWSYFQLSALTGSAFAFAMYYLPNSVIESPLLYVYASLVNPIIVIGPWIISSKLVKIDVQAIGDLFFEEHSLREEIKVLKIEKKKSEKEQLGQVADSGVFDLDD